ncbi:MAG: NUDIX hydrolase [Candidatus Spechtbacteria bacterium]|nr:NUDIX hydrolase [Candidatus Spechtbacteria bacterium]
MELQVGVKILLRNPLGHYLLVKRSADLYPEVGAKWDIVGGRIVPGFTLKENLQREIKEEIGLDYEGEPRLLGAQDILRIQDKHVVRLTYVGEIKGEPVVDGKENTEARWFTREEIQHLEPLDIYFQELTKRI